MGRAVVVGETDGLLEADADDVSVGDGVALGASDADSFAVDALDGLIARSRDSREALGVTSGSADCDSDGDVDALARGDALEDDALSDALALALADASTRG